jgi:hypothetical protein
MFVDRTNFPFNFRVDTKKYYHYATRGNSLHHAKTGGKQMEENYFAYFPGNYRWSAGLLLALATAPWGSGDIGEIDRIGKRLRTHGGNDEAWFQEWSRMGEALQKTAEEASQKGQAVTASGFFQRACMYYQVGERFRQPKDHQAMDIYRRSVHCFQEAAKRIDHPFIEPVEIPYENGQFLPALLVKDSVDRKGPMPAVIFFDGLDITKEICYSFGIKDLVRRGLACLIVDGPGNGETIRFRGLHLRYDQEVPAKAAIDYLESRQDINPERIGIMAISLGGYYAPRAAAFEKRLKACVAWGGQWDYYAVWQRRIKASFKMPLSVPPDHIFWVLGVNSVEAALKRLEKFRLAGVVERIECPFLLVHGEENQLASLEDARACYNAVGSKDKTLKVFTAQEGGSQHCQIDYLGVALPYMHDWLAEKLKP